MGFFSSLAGTLGGPLAATGIFGKQAKQTAKKVWGGAGDIAKVAAPFATLIPGVGPLLAAGLGAAGGALGTLNDPKGMRLGTAVPGALKYGAIGGAGGYGVEKGAGALGRLLKGGMPAPGAAGSSELARAASLPFPLNAMAMQAVASGAGGRGRGLAGLFGSVLGAAGGRGGRGRGLGTLAELLGLGSGAYGIYESGRLGKLREKALDEQLGLTREAAENARRMMAEAQPIRQAATEALVQRLLAGPRPVPFVAGLQDVLNPFRARFRLEENPIPEPRVSADILRRRKRFGPVVPAPWPY